MTREPTRVTSGSGQVSQISISRTNASRRKRLRVRRVKYTRQRKASVKKSGVVLPSNGHSHHLQAANGSRIGGAEEGGGAEGDRTAEISLWLSSRFVDEFKGVASSGFGDRARGSVDAGGSHGWVSVIGRRKEMEDTVRVELGFADKAGERYDFFGVYDGHGGALVAEACRERLHVMVKAAMEAEAGEALGEGFWKRVMERGFSRMDAEVGAVGSMNTIGSTAVVALVGLQEVVVANCGDSRAVLSRDGRALALSVDHKPDRADELERIESAGGRVINWNGHRVFGVLATSRSIGDHCLKPFIISKPEVRVMERDQADEFLVLASDGLWDVVSNELACQVVRKCLDGRVTREALELTRKKRAARAAALLAELAIARGSQDNVSIAVIDLGRSEAQPVV